jgi:hypothetical protein
MFRTVQEYNLDLPGLEARQLEGESAKKAKK